MASRAARAPRSRAARGARRLARRALRALGAAPREHDFFAVLRHVESLRPEQPRIGCALRPAQEALRLGQEPELDFAPAALDSFDTGAEPGAAPGRALLRPARAAGADAAALHRVRARAAAHPRRRDARALPRRLPPPAAVAVLSRLGAGAADGAPRPARTTTATRAWLGAGFGSEGAGAAPRALPDATRASSRPGCWARAAATPRAWPSCCASTSACRSASSSTSANG